MSENELVLPYVVKVLIGVVKRVSAIVCRKVLLDIINFTEMIRCISKYENK